MRRSPQGAKLERNTGAPYAGCPLRQASAKRGPNLADYSTRESVREPRRDGNDQWHAQNYSTRESVGEPRPGRSSQSSRCHYSTRESVGEPRLQVRYRIAQLVL